MNSKCAFSIEMLSLHLFWDVDRSLLSLDKDKRLIIRRVVEYGLLSDWIILTRYYSIDEVSSVASTLKSLDKKSANFIATLSGKPLDEFKCFTTQQSTKELWNY